MKNQDDKDFLALTEKEIFEEARDRQKIAADAESDARSQAREDCLFREGEQWEQKTITTASAEDVELTINLTDALCTRVVNNIKQQRPRGKCHPVGEGASIEISDIINGIGRHVETRSDAGVAYDNGADFAITAGWGWWRLVTEYVSPDSFQQDIRILPIFNNFSVYCDPEAMMPTASDANWIIISNKMKRTEYKRKYPKAENAAWNDVGSVSDRDDWEDKEEIRLAEYFRIREVPQKLYLLRDSSGNEFSRTKDRLPSPESLEMAKLEIEDERDSVVRRIEWFRLNGTKVVDRRIIPGQWIPLVRVQGNARNIAGKIYRRGMVRGMRDPARMVNYGEVAKIKRLGLTPKAPWVGAEGQFDGHPEWDNSNRESYAKLVYKPVTVMTDQGEVVLPAPSRQPPAQIEAGFSEFVQGMRNNLMMVAGMPNEPGADLPGEVISGTAIRRRQFLSDQSHYQYYDNTTLAIAQTWRIMLDWIPHYYSEERIQRIIGEDGKAQMVTINEKTDDDGVKKVKNDLSVGRYDVVMDSGPGYETRREEGAETLVDLMKTPLGEIVAKSGADLVFRSLDHPYMQELADRLTAMNPEGLQTLMEGLPDRAKGIITHLAGQNQQLQQALQQAQIEIKYGLQKEQMRAQTKMHDTAVRANTAAQDTVVKEQGALAREEIKAGASILNDRAKDNRALAQELISLGDTETNSEGSGNGRTNSRSQ